MPHSAKTKPQHKELKRKEKLTDENLLDLVQRQTFPFFWDGAQTASGLARDARDGCRIPRTTSSRLEAPALASWP